MTATISAKFRAGLALKGLVLLSLTALFGWLMFAALAYSERPLPVRLLAVALFAVIFLFTGWTTGLALADAVLGRAVQLRGAVALAKRRSGISFRLPDGRPAEFLLYNPWSPLVANQTYTVTVGRFSRVLVEPHVPEP